MPEQETCVYRVNRGNYRFSRFELCGRRAVVLDTMKRLGGSEEEWHCKRHSNEAFAERSERTMRPYREQEATRLRRREAFDTLMRELETNMELLPDGLKIAYDDVKNVGGNLT